MGHFNWSYPGEQQLCLRVFTPEKRFQFILWRNQDPEYTADLIQDAESLDEVIEIVEYQGGLTHDKKEDWEELKQPYAEHGPEWEYQRALKRVEAARNTLQKRESEAEEALRIKEAHENKLRNRDGT